MSNHKLWQKNANETPSSLQQKVETFTVGEDQTWDLYLAEFDAKGSLAHSTMLKSIGLLNEQDYQSIQQGLYEILETIHNGQFIIEEGVEDVHSQIELLLTRSKGEAGKKIHSGRSRNDQSLLDIKLFIRHRIQLLSESIETLFNTLIQLSNTHKDHLMPGYTHMQLAMPSSFGLWFGAYAESLSDDMELLIAAYHIANRNPLGSGAGYGSSFPIDRQLTTDLLNFDDLNYNVVYAQMTRGKTEKITAMAMASIAATLSKVAMDICLYSGQNFGFISFPDEITTGSSIMPHKKNPDVFELIRAKCNRIQALPNELTLLTNNLPSGYHRDMQLTKACLFPAIKELNSCIEMLTLMLQQIEINTSILKEEKYQFLFTVEVVNALVLSGRPFREAYIEVAKQIEDGTYTASRNIQHNHQGSIGNLCNETIKKRFYEQFGAIKN